MNVRLSSALSWIGAAGSVSATGRMLRTSFTGESSPALHLLSSTLRHQVASPGAPSGGRQRDDHRAVRMVPGACAIFARSRHRPVLEVHDVDANTGPELVLPYPRDTLDAPLWVPECAIERHVARDMECAGAGRDPPLGRGATAPRRWMPWVRHVPADSSCSTNFRGSADVAERESDVRRDVYAPPATPPAP